MWRITWRALSVRPYPSCGSGGRSNAASSVSTLPFPLTLLFPPPLPFPAPPTPFRSRSRIAFRYFPVVSTCSQGHADNARQVMSLQPGILLESTMAFVCTL